jgi:hypothetical protein
MEENRGWDLGLFVRFFEAKNKGGGVYPLTPQKSSTQSTQSEKANRRIDKVLGSQSSGTFGDEHP